MSPDDYASFTDALTDLLKRDPRVAGLVALGSMAAVSHRPDEWSDHDFWIIAGPGCAPALRDDRSWLPDRDRVVIDFVETEHGRSVVFDDGHLVEFAVFDDDELDVVSVNDFSVLIGGAELAARLAELADRTARRAADADVDGRDRMGEFVAQLVIGINRLARGETLSANHLVRGWAPRTLVSLIASFVPPEQDATLDDLDPNRRIELAYPRLAAEIAAAVDRPILDAAADLAAIAQRELTRVPAASSPVFEAVDALVRRARREVATSSDQGSARP